VNGEDGLGNSPVAPMGAEVSAEDARVARSRARLEVIAERNRIASEEAARVLRRDLFWTALACLGWMCAGLYCIGWSFHTTSQRYGWPAFLTGIIVGNTGILTTLARAYLRGERRGDW
jgi:hypothetical protein